MKLLVAVDLVPVPGGERQHAARVPPARRRWPTRHDDRPGDLRGADAARRRGRRDTCARFCRQGHGAAARARSPPLRPGGGDLFERPPRSIVADRRSRGARRWFAIAASTADLAIGLQLSAARYLDEVARPRIFEEAEPRQIEGLTAHATTLPQRLRRRLTWWKHARYLSRLAATMAAVTVVSDAEREALVAIGVDAAKVHVVPNGADGADLVRPRTVAAPARLIYPGAITYAPNLEAVVWCLNQVMPRVRAVRPDVQLWVTGDTGDLPLDRHAATATCVRFTGRLPDVKDVISGSAATVVPLQVGGGHPAQGAGVAGARHAGGLDRARGVEGLDVVDGTRRAARRHRPRRSAPRCGGCSTIRRWPTRLSAAGRARVGAAYTWTAIGQQLLAIVDAVSEGRHDGDATTIPPRVRSGRPFASGLVGALACLALATRAVSLRVPPHARGPPLHRPDVRRPRPRAVLVVGHLVAAGAVHPQHDDARAQRRPPSSTRRCGCWPTSRRCSGCRSRRCSSGGASPPRWSMGPALAVAAVRLSRSARAGAGRLLDCARRWRPRLAARRRRSTRCGLPDAPFPEAIYIVEPNTWYGLLGLSVPAAGAGVHADRAGRRLPRAHGAERRGRGRPVRLGALGVALLHAYDLVVVYAVVGTFWIVELVRGPRHSRGASRGRSW